MFRGALVTTAKRWEQPECPAAEESSKKRWSVHTREYYSAIKRNGALTHAATWMNLENITPSSRSQTAKTNVL